MKITKSGEPKEWTEYKNIPGVEFSGIPELQESLLREQGYLCAYCERRIPVKDKASNEDHRIEHWHCRNLFPNEIFDYGNLLMCCPGQIVAGESHCDVKKGNQVIEWSPLKRECIDSIKYRTDGTIFSTNDKWNEDINIRLNLNHEILKRNRAETLQGVINCINSGKNKGTSWTQKAVKDQLNKWTSKYKDGSNRLVYHPYCSIVTYYLEKKISSMRSGR